MSTSSKQSLVPVKCPKGYFLVSSDQTDSLEDEKEHIAPPSPSPDVVGKPNSLSRGFGPLSSHNSGSTNNKMMTIHLAKALGASVSRKGRPPKKGGAYKTSGRGRAFDPRVSDIADYGKKAWLAVQRIRKMINVEQKMFDSSLGSTAVTYGGTVQNLSNIAEGDDYNTRDGDSILVQRLVIRGSVVNNAIASQLGNPHVLRLIIARDMLQTAGADPAPSDFLESGVLSTVAAPYAQWAHRHDGNPSARRFRILHDCVFDLWAPYATTIATTGTGAVDTLGAMVRTFDLDLKVNAHTDYSNTTGADASNYVGALFLFAVSNVVTNGPALTYQARLYFTDN